MLHGAVRLGGNVYSVKTTVKRFADTETTDKAHAFSVEYVELPEGTFVSVKLSPGGGNSPISHAAGAAPASRLSALEDISTVGSLVHAVKTQDVSAVVDEETGEARVVWYGSRTGSFMEQQVHQSISDVENQMHSARVQSEGAEVRSASFLLQGLGLTETGTAPSGASVA